MTHLRNTTRARAIRTARARLKEQMKAGAIDAPRLIRGDDATWEPIAAITKLVDILMAVPGFGKATAADLLAAEEIAGDYRMEALTFERRKQIAELVQAALDGDVTVP